MKDQPDRGHLAQGLRSQTDRRPRPSTQEVVGNDTNDPMKAQTVLPELIGYQIIGSPRTRGPMRVCQVESLENGECYLAEWIDSDAASESLFARIRHHWQQNVHVQPAGCLPQREFLDRPDRLTRVIETPRGTRLSELLFENRFEVTQTLTTAIALTHSLGQWHSCSRVHGRLGGDCIFRSDDGSIELQEVTAFLGQEQRDFISLPARDVIFYSPESSGSLAREITPASDLYAVGVMMFTMLSGRAPIEATSASHYLDRQLCVEPPRLRELGLDIPRPLDDLIARLLRRDPRDRYETASGLLFDLEYVADMTSTTDTDEPFAIGTRDVRQSLTESGLVGREAEIERIRHALDRARARRPSFQVITSDELNSRRNFMDEVELCASAKKMHVFRGAAASVTPRPLQSLETVLSRIDTSCGADAELAERIAEATRDHAATLTAFLPTLSPRWPNSDDHAGPDEYGSQRAAAALEALLTAFAGESNGVTLLFDDLDLADELTGRVVRSLIERVNRADDDLSLCVIVSGASTTDLGVPAEAPVVHLGSISEAAIKLHLQSSAGRLDGTITESIAAVADGNPAMASAILGRMIDVGAVTPSKRGWLAQGQLSETLRGDESVAELLERQIGALSDEALEILSSAAVVGEHFELTMLSHVIEIPYADILQVATDALGRRLLTRDSRAGWFRFAHEQIHQRLQTSLSDESRRTLHLRTAEYLEQHDAENVFALAFHYDAAGIGETALQMSLEASAKARQQHSLSVALEQLRIAKRWVPPNDQATRLQISESLGEIQLLSGQYDEAAKSLHEALGQAHSTLEKSRVQRQIGELAFKRGQFAEAASAYEHALAVTGIFVPGNFATMLASLLGQSFFQVIHTYLPTSWIARQGTPSELDCLRLQLLSRLSHVYWFSRHKLWTLSNHLRSLNEAERFKASETLATVYSEHGPVMSLLRWFHRANRYAERSFEIRKQLGSVWGQGQSLHYHSVVMLAECRFQEAIDTSTRAVELLRKMGDFWEMNMARYQAANALYRIGRYEEAAEIASEMFHCGREIGDIQATGISLDVWARTDPQSLPLEIATEEAARSRPDAQSHAQTQLAFAVVLLHHNRIDEAIRTLENAIERSEKAGHLNTYISPCYAWLGTALRLRAESTDPRDGFRLQQRIAATRRLLRKASRIARGFPADRAHCYRERGILEAMRGNALTAMRLLDKSIASARKCMQSMEELESLRVLDSMYRQDPEFFGPLPADLSLRLKSLSEQHRPPADSTDAAEANSNNLSLADRFVTVLQSGRRIAQALSADVVYEEASQSARKLLRGQHADVVKISRHNERFRFEPLHGDDADEACRERVKAHRSLIRAAHKKGKAVCDATVASIAPTSGSAIAAPVAFRGDHVAVILVTHEELEDLFANDELRIAEFISTLAGAALENADGFLRLQQLNDTLEQRVLERTNAAENRARQLAVSNEQLRATEDQLREAIVHANSANEAKSRFLATISHEIRTPLNGILGMNRLARECAVDRRQANYLETVQESGQSLLTLINDLLDLSKLDAGKLELEEIPYNPSRVASEVSRLMAASAWQKGVELVCDIDPSVPDTIVGDPSRLRQIVMNLLGNAIKFTEEGFIALIMRMSRDDDGQPSQLLVSVQDSGIGIAADKQDKVFDSFSQADSSTTRRYGGTGLGLAICRELAEMMGGRIEIASEPGQGSEFTVLIPLGPDVKFQPPRETLKGRRIAVIDPLPAACHAVETALHPIGATVSSFAEPEDFEAVFNGESWDLVVFGCTGIDQIANRCADDNVPCLFLLPAHTGLRTRRGKLGAELRKPALAIDIIDAAETLILGSTTKSDLKDSPNDETAALSLPSDLPADDSTDRPSGVIAEHPDEAARKSKGIRILVAEDGPINQEVIVGILEMRGYQVVVAWDGEEAVRCAKADLFDLCLMDVDMPKMDGLEATTRIRQQSAEGEDPHLPIIAMTAHSGDEIWEKCLAVGMDAYLPKPIDPEALFAAIARFTGSDETQGMIAPTARV